ncbi:MAG: lysophospholipid acyltransferase family protein [Vicinamibacterales bacterium]
MTARAVRHRLEYGAVLAVRALVRILPDAVARGFGTLLGLAFHAVDRGHARLAVRQLQAAFPLRSPAECRAIARATFAHFGRLLVLVLRYSTLRPDQIRARVEFEGEDRVRDALALGRGVIVFSGHFGFWELQGLAHALVLPPMSVLARPLDNPYLHGLLERMRRATGNHVIYRQGAIRRVLRALANNECVAILIDQHIQPADAVTVDFFNRPAATTSALATLALRTGAPLVPAFALPLARGRFRLVYEHPVELPPPDAADPVRELTQRCTDVLEMYVRRHPHLWLWMHRRWRDPGPGAAEVPGMFPSAAADDRAEPVD